MDILQKAENTLENANNITANVQNSLEMEVASRANIDQNLTAIRRVFNNSQERINRVITVGREAVSESDQRDHTQQQRAEQVQMNSSIPVLGGTAAIGFLGLNGMFSSISKVAKDWIKNIINPVVPVGGNAAGTASSAAGISGASQHSFAGGAASGLKNKVMQEAELKKQEAELKKKMEMIESPELHMRQQANNTCTLVSSAMMMRSKAILDGNKNWATITEESTKRQLWPGALVESGSYVDQNNGINMSIKEIHYQDLMGDKVQKISDQLNQHPEGVVCWFTHTGSNWRSKGMHAVHVTKIDNGTIYCWDPAMTGQQKPLPIDQTTLGANYGFGNTQESILSKDLCIWYVSADEST